MKDYDKWGLGFIWVVAEMIGLLLGAWLGQQLYAVLEPTAIPIPNGYLNSRLIRNPFLRDLLVGLGVGLCTGIIEWLILHTYLKISSRWIAVSVISWTVAIPLGNLIDKFIRGDFVVAGLIVGLIVGVAQWSVLRRTCSEAAWWIVARTVGGTLYFMLSGLGFAIISGIAAVFFINSSISAAQDSSGIDQKVQS